MRFRLEFTTGDGDLSPVGTAPAPAAQQVIATGPDPAKVESVRGILRDAHGKVNEDGLDDTERRKRGNWLGGALRVYKELTGLDDMDHLIVPPSRPDSAAALIPGARFRKVDVTDRPGPHPGAQRPVPQEVLDAEAAGEEQLPDAVEAVAN